MMTGAVCKSAEAVDIGLALEVVEGDLLNGPINLPMISPKMPCLQ